MSSNIEVDVDPALLTVGPVIRNQIKQVYGERHEITIAKDIREIFSDDTFVILPNPNDDEIAITASIKKERVLRLLLVLEGRDLDGYPNLKSLKNVLSKLVADRIKIGEIGIEDNEHVGLTRKLFSLIDLAYTEAVTYEQSLNDVLTESELILKPTCALGANAILDDTYVDLMHKKGFDVETTVQNMITSVPTEFGVALKNKTFLSTNGDATLSNLCNTQSILELKGMSNTFNADIDGLLGTFGILVSFVPMRVMRNLFCSSTELTNFKECKPLLDQDWTATISMDSTTNSAAHTILTSYITDNKVKVNKVTGTVVTVTLDSDFRQYLDTTNKSYTVKTINGDYMTLEKWKGIVDGLVKVWNRLKGFATRNPEVTKIVLDSAANKFADIIKKKYNLESSLLSNFIDNGPSAITSLGDVPTLGKQICLNIIPALSNHIKSSSADNMFDVTLLRNNIISHFKSEITTTKASLGVVADKSKPVKIKRVNEIVNVMVRRK